MSNDYRGRWVVVTGARGIDGQGVARVEAMMDLIVGSGPDGMVFGGAWGTDTVALRAAWRSRSTGGRPKLVVVVPGRVGEQTNEATEAIQQYADETIELGLPLDQAHSFQTRNERMITEAMLRDDEERPVVVAFPLDGVLRGGTRNCMLAARRRGLDVREFALPARGGAD